MALYQSPIKQDSIRQTTGRRLYITDHPDTRSLFTYHNSVCRSVPNPTRLKSGHPSDISFERRCTYVEGVNENDGL